MIEPQVYSPIYKIIWVGDSGVGKTSWLSMYVKGVCGQTIPTVAVEFCTKEIQLYDGTIVKAQLWDTAGQERFKSLAMNYYRKARGIWLLFDVTKRTSFDACVNYWEDVRKNSARECIIYLIANKIDWIDEREVSRNEGELFAKKEELVYFETSALQSNGVQLVFENWLNDIYKVKKIQETEVNKTWGESPNNKMEAEDGIDKKNYALKNGDVVKIDNKCCLS